MSKDQATVPAQSKYPWLPGELAQGEPEAQIIGAAGAPHQGWPVPGRWAPTGVRHVEDVQAEALRLLWPHA